MSNPIFSLDPESINSVSQTTTSSIDRVSSTVMSIFNDSHDFSDEKTYDNIRIVQRGMGFLPFAENRISDQKKYSVFAPFL